MWPEPLIHRYSLELAPCQAHAASDAFGRIDDMRLSYIAYYGFGRAVPGAQVAADA